MHLANGDIQVQRGRLPEDGPTSVDETVRIMAKMAKGEYGSRSAKIRALAINIINAANVADKDYYGMAKAIHEWVRDQIRYIKDPIGDAENGETLNQETLSYPEETAFNSKAGDCDDKTILEIAMLGSLGIQSYPVVIGTSPGRYNHVYLNIVLPPGKYPHAGETIPADPIMREWPLGKEAPAYKVKLKKLYTDLSGLSMDLGAYASAPAYIDHQNVPSVGPVLKNKITDTGGRGQLMNVKQITRPSDDLDDMFMRGIEMPTQPAQLQSMYNRGPITARAERRLTSYLVTEGAKAIPRLSGSKMVEVSGEKRRADPYRDTGPTVGELLGMADYLSALEGELEQCDGFQGVAGPSDPIHKAAAAVAYTHERAKKATARVNKMMRGAGMFGLGEEQYASVLGAQQVEALAHTVAKKAEMVAKKGAKTPVRKAALAKNFRRLKTLNAVKTSDVVAAQPRQTDHIHDADIKVKTLATMMHSNGMVNIAHRTLVDRAARMIPGMPLKTPLKDAIVRDQFGRVIYAGDLAGGLGKFSLKKTVQKLTKAPQALVHAIQKAPQKLLVGAIKAPAKIVKGVIGTSKKFVDAHLKLGQTLHNTMKSQLKPSNFKAMFKGGNPLKKGGGGGAAAAAGGAAAAAATSGEQPYTDPSTGYVYDPATKKWTDPSTGDVYDTTTGQWTYANQNQTPPIMDPNAIPQTQVGPIPDYGNSYDPNTGMTYQPGQQLPEDPYAAMNYPDPFTDQDGVGPEQSEDFPANSGDQGPMPGSEFDMAAPGAGGPTAFDPGMDTGPQDEFGPEDMGPAEDTEGGMFMPGDEDTVATDEDSEGGGSAYADDDATESYATSGNDRRLTSGDSYMGPAVDGLGDVGGTSLVTLGLIGLGAYLLLKRK